MNIIKELEAMRKRMIQEINTEIDILIERAESEGLATDEPAAEEAYESIFPLTAGSRIFKGTKPTNVIFPGRPPIHVTTWKQVVCTIMTQCMDNETYKNRLFDLSGNISGKKRMMLAKTSDGMRSPLKLCDNGLYMETHYDTETLLNILTLRILDVIRYDYTGIQIAIRNR